MSETSVLARWDRAPGPGQRRPKREGAGGKVVLLVVLVLALLVAGGYTAAYLLARDRLPRGTTIAGVDLGGLSHDRAVQRLAAELAPRTQRPIRVEVDGRQLTVGPGTAGLGVDYDGSVAAGDAGRSWAPERLWTHYTAGPDLDTVVSLDPTRMTAALRTLASRVDLPARNGAVSFVGSGVSVREPVVGHALDLAAAQDALVRAFAAQVSGDDTAADTVAPVVLPTRDVRPDIDDADVKQAVAAFADPALAGPVTLRFRRGPVTLRTREVLPLISLVARGGRLVPEADEQLLSTLVGPDVVVGAEPVDASIALVGGAPEVVPSVPGTRYDGRDIASTLVRLLARGAGRRAGPVPTRPVPAAFGDRQARALRVREAVATVTVPMPPTLDLAGATSSIDGLLLKPGDELSLAARVSALGLSPAAAEQLASTVYAASLSAGLDVLERHAPLTRVARLPMGRDAVVSDAEDLRVANSSRLGVLVTATADDESLTVTLWSSPVLDVDVRTGAPHDVVTPGARTVGGASCTPRAGRPGFTVDVTRTFRRPGRKAVVRSDGTTTSYEPVDGVVCRPPPPTVPPVVPPVVPTTTP